MGKATAAVLAVCYLTLGAANWNDYQTEARPAFDALVGGHLHGFLQLAPGYAGSLLIRAPFVLLAHALGADEQWLFRASAIPCLVSAAALGVWLAAEMRRRGAGRLAQALVILLCAANPLTVQAVRWGHPEEVLGAALVVAAVLCALRDRPTWAGLLLGLAIANKQWAVVAVGPVLVALPRRRLTPMLWAGAVAAAVLLPFVLGAGGGLAHGVASGATATDTIFQRWQVWWFFGPPKHIPGFHGHLYVSARTGPAWLSGITHPLIAAMAAPLSALYVLRRRGRARGRTSDPLLLLALLMLLRCLLDPWDFVYYPLPFLLALLAWEVENFDRPPVASMTATAVAWLLMYETAMPILGIPQDVQSAMFLVAAVSAALIIGVTLYAPAAGRRLVSRPHREAVPVTA